MKITFKIIIFIVALLLSSKAFTQENNEQIEAGNSSQPLELPNFIIEGKVQLDIKSGSKDFPDRPLPLGQNQLDSMNTLEKQQLILLPAEPLPDKILNKIFNNGYIEAGFGRYAYTNFEVGYNYNYNEYSFFGDIGFDYSNGHIQNSGYNRFKLNLNSDYIAPTKFFIFGGSKTRTHLKFVNSNYHLYAVDKPANRNVVKFDFGLKSDGSYAGYVFSTGANFLTVQLDDNLVNSDSPKLADNLINGFLSIKNVGSDYELGANVNIDIENFSSNSVHLIELSAMGVYKLNNLTFDLKAGFQTGESSKDIARAGLLVEGNLNYKINSELSFKTRLFSGIRKPDFSSLIISNPYLSRKINIDFTYDMPSINAVLHYHPNHKFSSSFGLKFGSTDRKIVFDSISNGNIMMSYDRVNFIGFQGEISYELTEKDIFMSNFGVNYNSLSENGNIMPYSPIFKLSLDYYRKWLDNLFGTNFGVVYLGERYADKENNEKLEGYIDIRMKLDYEIYEDMTLSVILQNLLNSDIYIWQGYKERGIYFGLNLNYNLK